jgi:hypothetical protein
MAVAKSTCESLQQRKNLVIAYQSFLKVTNPIPGQRISFEFSQSERLVGIVISVLNFYGHIHPWKHLLMMRDFEVIVQSAVFQTRLHCGAP